MKRIIAVFMLMLAGGIPYLSGCATTGSAPGAASASSSDRDIADDVIDRLRQDPVTSRYPLSIISDEGVVTIGGVIGYEDAHVRAISIVRGTPGVKGVVDTTSR